MDVDAVAARQVAADAVQEHVRARSGRDAEATVQQPIPQRHRRRPRVVDVERVDLAQGHVDGDGLGRVGRLRPVLGLRDVRVIDHPFLPMSAIRDIFARMPEVKDVTLTWNIQEKVTSGLPP